MIFTLNEKKHFSCSFMINCCLEKKITLNKNTYIKRTKGRPFFNTCLNYFLIDVLLDGVKGKCILWLILCIKSSGKGVKHLHRKKGLHTPKDIT